MLCREPYREPYNGATRMRNKAKRNLIPTLLFAAIVVVSLNAWFAFRSVQVLVESEAWVQHTWQVIYQVELLSATRERSFRQSWRSLARKPRTIRRKWRG
jgi:hypothetical protein